jgi:hypothetical protein
MMEETDNQHQQLFLLKGQTVVSSLEGNGTKFDCFFSLCILFLFMILIESIELSNLVNENDNNSDSGISPNDSEVEVLIFDRKFYDKKEIFYIIFLFL